MAQKYNLRIAFNCDLKKWWMTPTPVSFFAPASMTPAIFSECLASPNNPPPSAPAITRTNTVQEKN